MSGSRSIHALLLAGLCFGLALPLAGCASNDAQIGTLRVVTYNVARGYALDLAQAPVIGAALPDAWTMRGALRDDDGFAGAAVFALQEVCGEHGEAHVAAIADALWADTPPSVVFHRADPKRPGACAEGTAIVSRLPMRDAGFFALPQVAGMVKTAVWADLELGDDRIVRVYSLHFDHNAKKGPATAARLVEMQAVLAHVAAYRAARPDGAVIVAGDLNTLEDNEPAVAAAMDELGSALQTGTTTHVLGWTLDWIFYGGLERRGADTIALPLSDHLAVRADFDPLARRSPSRP
jgi:endonuclease/exonuclease/phosphatase family metal-dependent hydrolase